MKNILLAGAALLLATACSPETCTDGAQNQNETAIDCGGVCSACETCSDGIQNQDETDIDCGGVCGICPITYPDNGYYGPNLLNLYTTNYPMGTTNFLSLHAVIPAGNNLKIVFTNTSSSTGNVWYFDSMSPQNLDISTYSFTTGIQVFQAMYSGQNIEAKLHFEESPGSATVEIYENWATTPTRTKNITW